MKTLADVVLIAAAMCSVFFVAGLSDVPRKVRYSVGSIGPAFMLTFILHWRFPLHVDFGMIGIGLAVTVSAITGFRFLNTAVLSKDARLTLIKRFAIIFAGSTIAMIIVAYIIVGMHPKGEPQPEQPTMEVVVPDTAKTVEVADSTQRAIDTFNQLAN